MKIKIEKYDPVDLDAIMEIENASFNLPWTRRAYEEASALDAISIWVAKVDAELVGYMLLQYVADELELHTFAVKPTFRKKGVGRKLMEHMLAEGKKIAVQNLFLQVRPSNVAARALYKSLGFVDLAVRRAYYEDDKEDAIIMKLILKNGVFSNHK